MTNEFFARSATGPTAFAVLALTIVAIGPGCTPAGEGPPGADVQEDSPPAPEVLTLATPGAAREMGRTDDLGTIEPGKLADLILVDGDPTTDISDIRRVVTVIKDGRVYDPAAIYRALGIRPCCQE